MNTRDEKWLAAVLTFYGLVILAIVGFCIVVDSCVHRGATDEANRAISGGIHGRDARL